ncbi:MAG: MarR family transcriptional regulator [Burkholderiaceae bacterium]|nr:MarR family transcriptional regulator [Burkholderiaceae bacterium]
MLVQDNTPTAASSFHDTDSLVGNHQQSDNIMADLAGIIGRQLPLYAEARLSYLAIQNGLSQVDMKALGFIIEFGSMPTGQLAQLVGLSAGGVAALINRLEAGGYIRRDRDKNDRRVVALKPIMARCQRLVSTHDHALEPLVAAIRQFSDQDLEQVHKVLSVCLQAMRQDTIKWMALEETSSFNTGYN